MFIYSTLYAQQALLTMVVTNILLFGLADTLAQTLTSLMEFSPDTSLFNIKWVFEKAIPKGGIIQVGSYDSDDEGEGAETLVELGLADDFNFSTVHATQPKVRSRTNSISSFLAQEQVGFNFRRLSLFMVWGVIQAFLQYCWYAILNDVYSEDNLFLSALKRVLSDQLCYSPLSLAAFFVYTTVVIDRGDLDAVRLKLRTKYLQTLVVNYAIWPLAQFVNFLLMPRAFQVPFASTIGVFWNAYLSLKNAKG